MDQALKIPIPEFQLKKTPVAKPPQPLSKKASESLKFCQLTENMVAVANTNDANQRIRANSAASSLSASLDARQDQKLEAVASVLCKIAMP